MKKDLVLSLILLSIISVMVMGAPFYIINGENVQKFSGLYYWKDIPFIDLEYASHLFDLKWSFKDGMGIIENGKNFISFNASSGEGLYDAIYYMKNVATNVTKPLISLEALSKLLGLSYSEEPEGEFLIENPPTLRITGAILYGNTFTIFFNSTPSASILKIETSGIVTRVGIMPVSFSNYLPPNSPLIAEKRGAFSVIYSVTDTSTLNVMTSVGSPTLPVQQSNFIDFGNGVSYEQMKSQGASSQEIGIKILKLSQLVTVKMSYPQSGFGNEMQLNSISDENAIAVVAFKNTGGLIYSNGKIYGAPIAGLPALTWNGKKFDIIETDQVVTVNIGNVPLVVDGVDGGNGNVLLYAKGYGPEIPYSNDRSYFEVGNGRILGIGYTKRATASDVLSINKIYSPFLGSVYIGQIVSFMFPFDLINLKLAIQGKAFILQNSNRVQVFGNFGDQTNCFFAGLKADDLYLVNLVSQKARPITYFSDLFMNMGFSDVIYLGNNDQISMIIGNRMINKESESALFKFWIEIDKTTGGA